MEFQELIHKALEADSAYPVTMFMMLNFVSWMGSLYFFLWITQDTMANAFIIPLDSKRF